jgi:hypothetical protein
MYEAPTVTELGSVADFTRAGSPNQAYDGTLYNPISFGPSDPRPTS